MPTYRTSSAVGTTLTTLVNRRRRCDLYRFIIGICRTDEPTAGRNDVLQEGHSRKPLRKSFMRERNAVGGRWQGGVMNTSLKVLLLLSLLNQTNLEVKDGRRDHGNERECPVEESPGSAAGPLLHLVIAGTMGKNPRLVQRLPVEG